MRWPKDASPISGWNDHPSLGSYLETSHNEAKRARKRKMEKIGEGRELTADAANDSWWACLREQVVGRRSKVWYTGDLFEFVREGAKTVTTRSVASAFWSFCPLPFLHESLRES